MRSQADPEVQAPVQTTGVPPDAHLSYVMLRPIGPDAVEVLALHIELPGCLSNLVVGEVERAEGLRVCVLD